jgi:hypothetical protein
MTMVDISVHDLRAYPHLRFSLKMRAQDESGILAELRAERS